MSQEVPKNTASRDFAFAFSGMAVLILIALVVTLLS